MKRMHFFNIVMLLIASSTFCSKTKITIVQGDLSKVKDVDCIVNPANKYLNHKGTLAAKINKAAGQNTDKSYKLQTCCNKLPDADKKNLGVKLLTGEAISTSAFDLGGKVQYIIHAVGPDVVAGNQSEKDDKETLLLSAYGHALRTASSLRCKTIALTSISAGAFGYDIKEVAPIAYKATMFYISEYPDDFEEIRFVLWTEDEKKAFEEAFVTLDIKEFLRTPLSRSSQQNSITDTPFSKNTIALLTAGGLSCVGVGIMIGLAYYCRNSDDKNSYEHQAR